MNIYIEGPGPQIPFTSERKRMQTHPFPENPRAAKEQPRTPMDTALRFLAARPRTVREMERHLDERQFGEYEAQQVVDRLLELSYLDDAAYAAEFVRTRLNTKPVSRGKLREQMLAHELPPEVVDRALQAVGDEAELENAVSVARKYAKQVERLEEPERRQRLIRRLTGRGFSYEVSRRAAELADRDAE